MQLNFHPFPILTTERLILRQITLSDENEVFFLRSDAYTLKHIKRTPAKSLEEVREWIQKINQNIENNESLIWAISLKDNPKQIGTILLWNLRKEHFRAEVGYVLHPHYHQQGIMNEAIGAVIDFAFHTLGFHSLEALIDPENEASGKLLEKNNFVQEGYFKEDFYFEGKFLDTAVFSLVVSNWKAQK